MHARFGAPASLDSRGKNSGSTLKIASRRSRNFEQRSCGVATLRCLPQLAIGGYRRSRNVTPKALTVTAWRVTIKKSETAGAGNEALHCEAERACEKAREHVVGHDAEALGLRVL